MCRSADDLDAAGRRVVDIATSSLYVTFFRPNLALPPNQTTPGIKGVGYGVGDGHVNAAYEWKDGRTALKPLATLVVTATKTEAKAVLELLRERADYDAFMESARRSLSHEAQAAAAGKRDLLRGAGREAEADEVVPDVPITTCTYTASEAYIFQYAAPPPPPHICSACSVSPWHTHLPSSATRSVRNAVSETSRGRRP